MTIASEEIDSNAHHLIHVPNKSRAAAWRRVDVQFRAEAINVLNHPNFANPGNDISNAGTFGFITATTGTGERNLRFGLRIAF